MFTSSLYADALRFAATAHAGQVRKGTAIPYVTHPLAVSGLVVEFGGDEEQAIAALLHDVVEDCDVSLLTISDTFGVRVAAIVEGCTDGVPDALGRKAPWKARKARYLEHLELATQDTLLVSACDKLHNARSIVADVRIIGGAVFDRFTAGRDQTIWYYRSLAGVFRRQLKAGRLARLLEYTINDMADYGPSGGSTAL